VPGSTPRRYKVSNRTRGTLLAESARLANNPLTRAVGLMFRKSLPPGGGLIIRPCNAVVCFFMRFPIDVIFVDEDGAVRYIIPAMRPWRVSRFVRGAKSVIELPAGAAAAAQTCDGDLLVVEEVG